jgi:hypothetical protein
MSTAWNIKDTENHILRIYGREQLALVRQSLQSVELKRLYAYYHYHEAKKLFENFMKKELKTKHPLKVILQNTPKQEQCRIKVEANVLACLSNMHTIPDTFAHIIYYCFGLNLNSKTHLPERDINVTKVLILIKEVTEFKTVYEFLTSLNTDGYFHHLSAIVNHSKHKFIKRLGWNFSSGDTYSLTLPAYRYKNFNYQEIEFKTFLEPEYNRMFKLHVELGNAINKVLIRR